MSYCHVHDSATEPDAPVLKLRFFALVLRYCVVLLGKSTLKESPEAL
jgi:hypothetical protein